MAFFNFLFILFSKCFSRKKTKLFKPFRRFRSKAHIVELAGLDKLLLHSTHNAEIKEAIEIVQQDRVYFKVSHRLAFTLIHDAFVKLWCYL